MPRRFPGSLIVSTFTPASTRKGRSSGGAELGYFVSGITDWTTALRAAHAITTTHTTGGALGYASAVIR